MQVIPTIVGGEQTVGMLWVTHNTVEIDDRVKVANGTDPRVHRLPISLTEGAWMVVG